MALLEKIRVKLGALITVLIAVALLSFIIDPSTLQSAMSMFSSKYDVGEINGEGIPYQEYQQKVDYFSQIFQMTNGSASDDQTQELINNTAWQNEITERVLIPAVEAAGVTLGEEELYDLTQGVNISPVLMSDPSFVGEDGQFSRQRVAELVQAISQDQTGQLGMYWNYLEDNIEKTQKVSKYLSLLEKSMFLSPVELNRAIAENNTSYNVDFIMQPYGFALDSTITVDNSEVKEYYEKNKNSFKQVESRDLEYVVFEVVPSEEDIQLAQQDMEKVYNDFVAEENVKTFLARNSDQPYNPYFYKEGDLKTIATELEDFAAKAKVGETLPPFQQENTFIAAKVVDIKQLPDSVFVKHILLQGEAEAKADSLLAVAKKGNFAELAAEYSADQNPNVAEAGDLGWMTQQYMIPGMESVLTAKKGDVFTLKTTYGTHIVKVTDATKPMKKMQVALLVKEAVASKATYSDYYAKANDIASKAEGNLEKFNAAAKESGVSVYPAMRVLPGAKTLANYQHTREISRWANENEVGSVSPIITVDNKYFFVVGLKAIHAEGYTPYNEIAPTIKSYLMMQKKGEKVAAETKAKLEGVTTIEAAAEKLGTTVSNQSGIAFSSLTSQQLDPKFIGAIAGAPENTLVGPVVGEIGVYYFTVKGKETGAFYTEDDAKARNQQIFAGVQNVVPVILLENAGVKDRRYKFF
ncbi:MAG: SurA N-terminal domain-containing protein [Bacteroidales bacterium]|nr:SurA N-terminal domain-containing protein [Bacteroidales bacterium]